MPIEKLIFWGSLALLLAVGLIALATGRFDRKSPLNPPALDPGASAIGLQAERQSAELKLTWNRDAAAVRNAASGVLSISDGGSGSDIKLDSATLRSGSYLYTPATDHVETQLTVFGPKGASSSSESLLVIMTKPGDSQAQSSAIPPARTDDANEESRARRRRAKKVFVPPPIPQQTAPAATPVLAINDPPPVAPRSNPAAWTAPELPRPAAPAPPRPSPAPQSSVTQQSAPPAVYSPPVVAHSVTPLFPSALRGVSIKETIVKVKVSIDDAGRVSKAELVPGSESPHQLVIRAALEAARTFKFQPARRGTQPISSEMVLQFEFKPQR